MSSDEKRPLGKILLQRKLVSPQELETALRAQKRSVTPTPIASQLVAQGKVDEIEALRALSEQHGVPGIDLTQVAIVLEHLDVASRQLAESNRILPVLVRGERIFLAVADPKNKRVIDELEFVTGKKVFPYIAVQSTLTKAIVAAYDAKERGEHHYLGPRVPPETLRQLGLAPGVSAASTQPTLPAASAASPATATSPATTGQANAGTSAAAVKPPVATQAASPVGAASPPSAPRPGAARAPLLPIPGVAAPAVGARSAARAASPPPAHPPAGASAGPAFVVDEAVESASQRSELSTSDFGQVGEEVSSITNLPDDLRERASLAVGAVGTGTGKLVLVVDDDEEIRKLLRRLLTQKGRRVLEADRGLLALRLVKDHVPDLIILDAMLPELHGFDIARRIKGSAKYGGIPIIMMSAVYRGWRIAEDLKQNYGVEEYLEKPFRIADVLDVVQKLLARSEGHATEGRDPEYLSAEAESALRDGVAAYKAGKVDPAIEHLRRGIAIDPLAYRLHFHIALLYGKKGLIYEGIQELERAIDLNPRHYPALKNLAVLYEKAGFKNKAVEMWERCAANAPDDATRASLRDHLRQLI